MADLTIVNTIASPELNARRWPKLTSQLKPGSRSVSETRNHTFLWRVP